jgi:hypothetical protein
LAPHLILHENLRLRLGKFGNLGKDYSDDDKVRILVFVLFFKLEHFYIIMSPVTTRSAHQLTHLICTIARNNYLHFTNKEIKVEKA